MGSRDWIDLARDAETGIETLRAHFEGHAYDPHWHDSYLIGYTEIGVQQFNCRRRRHDSTAGQVFLVEPGEIHDGRAPIAGGFTYSMLYLQPDWLRRELRATFDDAPSDRDPGFHANLTEDPRLTLAIAQAFRVLHGRELRLLRQTALELVLERCACTSAGARRSHSIRACRWWRRKPATTCMRTSTRTSAWKSWPAPAAPTASA